MIEFNAENHEYKLDGKVLLSVTQLMKKHGLAPNYDGVPEEVLNAKAARGSLIHEEIENYVKSGEDGFTDELDAFKRIEKENGLCLMQSETIVYNDLIAGTVDLTGRVNGNETFIADIKTTAALHLESIRWQLSIYAYLFGKSFDHFYAIHLTKDGGKLKEVEPIEKSEVQRLFDCERANVLFSVKTLAVDKLVEEKAISALRAIATAKMMQETAQNELDSIRTALLEEMRKNGVLSFENDFLKIKYVAPYEQERIDSARLKKELPEIADKFMKKTMVKESVRIALKDAADV